MPTLPTVDVTAAQANKILAAFGGTQAVAIPAYKEWLITTLRAEVIRRLEVNIDESLKSTKNTEMNAALVDLPPEPFVGPIA